MGPTWLRLKLIRSWSDAAAYLLILPTLVLLEAFAVSGPDHRMVFIFQRGQFLSLCWIYGNLQVFLHLENSLTPICSLSILLWSILYRSSICNFYRQVCSIKRGNYLGGTYCHSPLLVFSVCILSSFDDCVSGVRRCYLRLFSWPKHWFGMHSPGYSL